ncbi:hypothetical protein [Staphylococcus aureus]|uniref:hypothetical protein n=1 Tax=Staphylococcus aureus TaxID=1280 RepID=UPI0034A36CE2
MVSRKYGKREALKEDHTDINTFSGDRDVLTLEQMFQQYNIIPDAGAISKTVRPTAIVGHAFIDNNWRFRKVKLAKRDENNNIIRNDKGEIKYNQLSLLMKNCKKKLINP